jgi:hypothetical protein
MAIQRRPFTVASVALLLFPLCAAVAACGGGAQAVSCTPTYVYSNVKSQGSALYVVDIETDYNGSPGDESATFSDQRTGSFTIEDSSSTVIRADATVDDNGQVTNADSEFSPMSGAQASAAFSYVHGTDHSVKTSTSLSITNTPQVEDIPPGATAYGLFGVVVKITNGDLISTNCPSLEQNSHETVLLPQESEWCTWIRGPDEFTDGGQSHCVVVADGLAG